MILLAWSYLLLGAGIEMEQMDMGGGQMMLMAPPGRQLRGADFPYVGHHDDGDDAAQRRAGHPAGRRFDAPTRRQPHLGPTGLFVLGYLVIWFGFSVAATVLQWGLDRAGLLSADMASGSATLAGLLLIAAGLYQWTPLKQACLVQCRSPFEHLTKYWRQGALGPMLAGAGHGAILSRMLLDADGAAVRWRL